MSTKSSNIAHIRKEYALASLDEALVGDDPILFFKKWFGEAEEAEITEVNAMTLSTVDSMYQPHSRIVLLKGLDDNGFVFFTNYDSAKGRELLIHPHASLLFFWKELERQVRVEGVVEKIAPEESDLYFHSRPVGSQIGAWSSPQSQPIASRNILELNYAHYEKEFSDIEIPRPLHWGGYKVVPSRIEFWQGRKSRLHDRILFTLESGNWGKSRLAP